MVLTKNISHGFAGNQVGHHFNALENFQIIWKDLTIKKIQSYQ